MSKNDTLENAAMNERLYALEDGLAALKLEVAGARRAQPSLNMGIQAALDSAIKAAELAIEQLEAKRDAAKDVVKPAEKAGE